MVVSRVNLRVVFGISAAFVALAIYLALGAGSASAHAGHDGGIHHDLAAEEGPCGPGMVPVGDLGLCTHGPDPAPPGVTAAELDPPAEFTTAAGAICDGNGTSGNRVQVLYVRATDKSDRYSKYVASFRTWAQQADMVFQESAKETGGDRYIRFVHNSNCTISVVKVTVPTYADDSFESLIDYLYYNGHGSDNRKYLIFLENSDPYACGVGGTYLDDSAGQNNMNNIWTSWAVVYSGCWSDSLTAAHELAHAFGAVQDSAPNSSGYGHCTDEWDIMCYPDGPGVYMTYKCLSGSHEYRLDCNHDDYFHTSPPSGNYLTTHWNIANSRFLGGNYAKVTLSKTSSKYNGWVVATVSGFQPNANVNLRWPGGTLLAQLTTNGSGAGSASFRTPLSPLGNYDVRATDSYGHLATVELRVIPRIMLNSCDDASDYSGPAGECIRVYYYGFAPGDRVQIQWYASGSNYIVLKTITIADNGRGTTLITIPLDASEGAHTIRGKVIGVGRSATTTFTVTGPAAAEEPTATPTPTETATPEPSPTETGTPEAPVDGTPVEETPTEEPTEDPGTPEAVETPTPEIPEASPVG